VAPDHDAGVGIDPRAVELLGGADDVERVAALGLAEEVRVLAGGAEPLVVRTDEHRTHRRDRRDDRGLGGEPADELVRRRALVAEPRGAVGPRHHGQVHAGTAEAALAGDEA
jgi:hypothetical protein